MKLFELSFFKIIFIIWIILKIIMVFIYIIDIIKNKSIKEVEQFLWIMAILFLGDFLVLIYWFIYIRKRNFEDIKNKL
jgi:hypothetical protein